MQRGLVTVNEMNDKFMRTNIYAVMIAIGLYIAVGVAVYHNMMHWSRLNALYFLVVTICTIGYGDLVPLSPAERLFTAFYILVGIAICSGLLGVISTFVQDHQVRVTKQRNMRALLLMKDEDVMPTTPNSPSMSHGISLTEMEEGSGDISPKSPSLSSDSRKARRSSILDFAYSITAVKKKTLAEFRDASLSAYDADYKELHRTTLLDFVGIFIVLLVGMGGMAAIEGWGCADSFYCKTLTIITVPYFLSFPYMLKCRGHGHRDDSGVRRSRAQHSLGQALHSLLRTYRLHLHGQDLYRLCEVPAAQACDGQRAEGGVAVYWRSLATHAALYLR
jgi:hypothetical protein